MCALTALSKLVMVAGDTHQCTVSCSLTTVHRQALMVINKSSATQVAAKQRVNNTQHSKPSGTIPAQVFVHPSTWQQGQRGRVSQHLQQTADAIDCSMQCSTVHDTRWSGCLRIVMVVLVNPQGAKTQQSSSGNKLLSIAAMATVTQ